MCLSCNFLQMVTRTKKIFVGGLSANTVVEDVKQYFEQFGKVSSCPSEQCIFELVFFLPLFFKYVLKASAVRPALGAPRCLPFSVMPRSFWNSFCLLHVYVYVIANTFYLH